MQKKKFNIRIVLLLYFSVFTVVAYGQVEINIPEANIRNRTEYQQEFPAGNYAGLLNLLPTISTGATTANFDKTVGEGSAAPLNLARISLVSIANISLIGVSNEVTLTSDLQVLSASVANLLSGPVLANARLNVSGHTWRAGTYYTKLEFLAPGLLGIGNRISPANHDFNINIPAFITPQTDVGVRQILINDLSFYRTPNGISADEIISLSSTVPYIPSLQTANAQFNFSTSSAYNRLPTSPVKTVNATLTGVPFSTSIFLSSTDQDLTTASIAVATNNTRTINHNFFINASDLKQSFVQAGTYSVPLTYTWNKPTVAYPSGALQAQRAGTLEVVVSDLAELVANQNSVDLAFTTTSDYQTGVVKDMPAHLRISKTTPYNLYVRASSADFASGMNSIPLNVLRIGPMTGETGMNTVTLSTTPQQLINAADPVIDRQLNVRYSIPASEISKLLNKPLGTYSTDIVFSFVAP